MSLNPSRLSLGRTSWIVYGIAEVTLFVLANLTANSASHPGTVSQICFVAFIIGLVLAILLGGATPIRQRRAAQ